MLPSGLAGLCSSRHKNNSSLHSVITLQPLLTSSPVLSPSLLSPPIHPSTPTLPLFLSVWSSPWPRKVAMETEADLMQRREMNYTVRGSCVCACVCSRDSGLKKGCVFFLEGGFNILCSAVIFFCEYFIGFGSCVHTSACDFVSVFVRARECGSLSAVKGDVMSYFWLGANRMWTSSICVQVQCVSVSCVSLCQCVLTIQADQYISKMKQLPNNIEQHRIYIHDGKIL